MSLIHFLLVYDHVKGELLQAQPFENSDDASEAYARVERENRGNPELEIVLVGADSIETIEKTHGNYFNGSSALDVFLAAS